MDAHRRKLFTGWLSLHLAVALFGLAGVIGKLVVLPAIVIVFARTAISALFLFFFKRTGVVSLREVWPFTVLALLLAFHWVTFFLAIQMSSLALGLLSFSTFPVFTALLEPWFMKERFSLRSLGVAVTVFFGLVITVPEFNFSNSATQGVLVGVLSGLSFALLSILNRKFACSHSPFTTAMWQNGLAAIFLAPLLVLEPVTLTGRDLALLLFLGVFCTAGAHSLFIRALREVKAQFASIVAALEPVYGVILGYLLLSEVPALRTVIGGAIIIGVTVWESVRMVREARR